MGHVHGDEPAGSNALNAEVAAGTEPSSQKERDEERKHFESVLKAYDSYLPMALANNERRRRALRSLPPHHRSLLEEIGPVLPPPALERSSTAIAHGNSSDPSPIVTGRGVRARLDEIDDRIRRNADLLGKIVGDSRRFMESAGQYMSAESSAAEGSSVFQNFESKRQELEQRHQHQEKVRSTLKQLVRDWSKEGKEERSAAYGPIIQALEARFGHLPLSQRSSIHILVPGAGLGRLAWEFAHSGYSSQGNEFSFFMLLASHFILNESHSLHEHIIYPHVHFASNWRTAANMLQPVSIPDVIPSDLPEGVDFSMVAGEFVEVYSRPGERERWQCVATSYFIDTAKNVVRYIEIINQLLQPGGYWINAGPLLWHFETADDVMSIELTLDETMDLVRRMGFEVEECRMLPMQLYTGTTAAMLQYNYVPAFWVARKVASL
ncbi:hypothetical protein OC846_003996 [Tilletia horrida]|uniref:carnosine N-methyltransferase n=1 Tax=Tilletia horrida TaxID=155126 RepID=A0AAN6GRH4_9BASI|nr:hypothetical protein OC845_005332 [Tilletia horrida]KAK0549645.1 hypothetical protein OC846_003996 [Tilletia horrida]